MMEIRRAIKKIIALGIGVIMVGVIVLGVMVVVDLGSYPVLFVVGSIYDVVVIVGVNVKVVDLIGVVDILFGLSFVEG